MQRNRQTHQQNNLQRNQQGEQQENQQVSFECISFSFYLMMALILITLIISIFAATQNEGEKQIICILLTFMLIVLLGCVLYMQILYSDANDRQLKLPVEKSVNQWFYSCTFIFFFEYSSSSQFTANKWTYIYIIITMIILAQNFVGYTYSKCFLKNQDTQQQPRMLEDTYNSDQYCIQYYTPPKFEGPMLMPLGIMCIIIFSFFVGYEGISFISKINQLVRFKSLQSYQYINKYINIPKVIFRSKALCIILMINNFLKLIALLVIIILTPNDTSYILIVSNLIFHVTMILIIMALLKFIAKIDIQNNKIELFFNHQILIDEILKLQEIKLRLLKLLLVISFILTIVGQIQFVKEEKSYYQIINYDNIIIYDCAIFQLIINSLIILKYLFCSCFNGIKIKFRHQNISQVMQDSEIYNQPQQVLYREQQHQFIENVIPRVQNNRKKAKLEPIQNINNSFIYQVELKNKVDCIICLQQMLEKSNKDPIVQLRCHTSHIFHKLCITEWLNQNKKCPICNKEFK